MKTIKVQWVIRRTLCLVCVPLLAGGLMVAQQQFWAHASLPKGHDVF